MRRRHYLIIARIIYFLPISKADRLIVAEDFANQLDQTSSNFKRDVFLKTCKEGA